MKHLVSFTAWGLLFAYAFAGLKGIKRWNRYSCQNKLITTYMVVSAILCLLTQISVLRCKDNHWVGHLSVLSMLIVLSQWILLTIQKSKRSSYKVIWGLGIFLWFVFAFTLGITSYYPYMHMYASILCFSGALCSRHNTIADRALIFALAAEIVIACSIPLGWHARFPLFWTIRNVVWIVFLILARRFIL